MPNMRGMENPQMSASMTPTAKPRWASAAARLAVTDDLPTPPLPDATASTRAVVGIVLGPAALRASRRAMPMALERSSAVISVQSMDAPVTPGSPSTRLRISRLELGPQWAPGGGEGEGDGDVAGGGDLGTPSHAQLDDVGPELGVDDTAAGRPAHRRRWEERSREGFYRREPCKLCRWPRHPIQPLRTACRGLDLLKALGDNTRYAIYLELARSPLPLATAEVAEALDLHVNTVRPHLERMRDVGLLQVDTEARGTVGRPQHR